MRKKLAFLSAALILTLCGCSPTYNNSSTRFLMDTVVNITADAEHSVITEAMNLAESYDKLFSKTVESSDVSRLNEGGSVEISEDTLRLLKSAAVYSERTNGAFDVTIGAVSSLWDFTNGVIPSDSDIKAALGLVDYKKITFSGKTADLNGGKIDLGGCAKGFVADKLHEFLVSYGVEKGVVDLGGNLYIIGGPTDVGIKSPSGEGAAATVRVYSGAVVTAGTFERSFEKDNKTYHHILNTKTGYPVDSDIVSATVFSESALEADILSTCLVALGLDKGMDLIEKTEGVEALFITSDGEIHISSGIYCKDGIYRL